MDESSILEKFDELVKLGVALCEDEPRIIKHTDGGLTFQFVLTSALAKKPTIKTAQPASSQTDGPPNHRRPGSDISTHGFELTTINNTHVLAANKFCYARPHLMLLTTSGFARQHTPLTTSDFAATITALNGFSCPYLAFYNCGVDGGCSRLHKHLQLLPQRSRSFASFLDAERDGRVEKIEEDEEPKIPFQWFWHRFSNPESCAVESIKGIYDGLLTRAAASIGLGQAEPAAGGSVEAAVPHNMLLTKRWMVVIPRRKAAINPEAGVNALGMVGVIAVATEKEIEKWKGVGLTQALRELGVPRESERRSHE
ncbi:MAG: hypothetical protein M1820_003644 [Bogoriella megaspora]|nr:MAG: hypothetical protein M1820_003644 [Bogoriella megaspora]